MNKLSKTIAISLFVGVLLIIGFACTAEDEQVKNNTPRILDSYTFFDENFIYKFYDEVLDTLVKDYILISSPDAYQTWDILYKYHGADPYHFRDRMLKSRLDKFKWMNEKMISRGVFDYIFDNGASLGWTRWYKLFGHQPMVILGLPIFSPNLKYAMVYYDWYSGPLSGFAVIITYRYNRRWTLINTHSLGVS